MDLERQKQNFRNHVAKFTDHGNIKILDFKNPDRTDYRIRFMFEEDYYRLHISGDLGELIASNYNNMTYERFEDYIDNKWYFMGKIDCCSRKLYTFREDDAEKDLREIIQENELEEEIIRKESLWTCENEDEKEDVIRDFIEDVLRDYNNDYGIGSHGYEKLSEYIDDAWEFTGDIGKRDTEIVDLYLLAFKLAKEQLGDK